MYLKLMVRGLSRHKKKGKRLFLLLSLCSAVVIFLLTFKAEFSRQYRDLFIGTTTGHLQVLPPEARIFAKSPFGSAREELPLFTLEEDLRSFTSSMPEVEASSGTIQLWGNVFNLDSEQEDSLNLLAVDPLVRSSLYPLSPVLEGEEVLTWSPGDTEVPVLRNRLYSEFGQTNPDHSRFGPYDLRLKDEQVPAFGVTLAGDHKSVFPREWASAWPTKEAVIAHLDSLLPRPLLWQELKADVLEPYDYKVDDAVEALKENTDPARWGFLNKRLLQALYPDQISRVWEPVVPGKSVTLQLPPARSEGVMSSPVVIPARYTGMVDFMPLYSAISFMNLESLQYYLGLAPDQVTTFTVRLKRTEDTPAVKAMLEKFLADRGSRLKVADYQLLGQIYLATAMAFDVVIGLLVGIFLVILVIFVVNMVLLSVIQRRREIGTSLALGLSGGQNTLIMTGEVLTIVSVSWLAGALLGAAAVFATKLWGLPGMIFFPGGKIFLDIHPEAFLISLGLFLLFSTLSALGPLAGLRKHLPVDLLKEAS